MPFFPAMLHFWMVLKITCRVTLPYYPHALFVPGCCSLAAFSVLVKLLVAHNAAVEIFICSVRGMEMADFSLLANPVSEVGNRENRNCYC